MNNADLKEALLNKKPVIYTNAEGVEAEYKCVSAIRYTEKNGRVDVSVEITDLNERSVTICKPEKLRYKEKSNGHNFA